MIKSLVQTRIPTSYGEFTLHCYSDNGKEHLALVRGDVQAQLGVPVRVHSECLTGDVFGSRRCDCGEQLKHTLRFLGRSRIGILIYLRQEGRGIGLRKKLEAYNLQDRGLDTFEANVRLGHQPDERDYGIAALILKDLGIRSISLITNNPRKIEELQQHSVEVESRIPIEVGHHADNLEYLRSKATKMAHWLTFRERPPSAQELSFMAPLLDQLYLAKSPAGSRPFVSLTYAQSIDGSIAVDASTACALSSRQSLELTHMLRAHHDALLVGVNTILTDDPQLTVRFWEGPDPRPVILDSSLRFPLDCRLRKQTGRSPIVMTTKGCDPCRRETLIANGVEVIEIDASADGSVDLRAALSALQNLGIRTVMVEGGARIIASFLKQQLVDYCVITITPKIIGGLKAIDSGLCGHTSPLNIADCQYHVLGSDVIAFGPIAYS